MAAIEYTDKIPEPGRYYLKSRTSELVAIGDFTGVLDRAWELLPFDAAAENTIVIQEMSRRREELKRKKGA